MKLLTILLAAAAAFAETNPALSVLTLNQNAAYWERMRTMVPGVPPNPSRGVFVVITDSGTTATAYRVTLLTPDGVRQVQVIARGTGMAGYVQFPGDAPAGSTVTVDPLTKVEASTEAQLQ